MDWCGDLGIAVGTGGWHSSDYAMLIGPTNCSLFLSKVTSDFSSFFSPKKIHALHAFQLTELERDQDQTHRTL